MRPTPLVNCFTEFCKIKASHDGSGSLNLMGYQFFNPTTLLPVLGYMVENSIKANVQPKVYGYVSAILPNFLINKPYVPSKTYVPLRKLTPGSGLISKTTEEVVDLADSSYGGKNAVWYLLTELGNNIENHSKFTKAFMMAQRYDKLGFTEFCVYDNGISIPGNFESYGINFTSDSNAIEQAMNGKSTKKELNGRGWGINSLVQIFTEGIEGELFIASRNGAVFINNEEVIKYILRGIYNLDGTLVSLRIPKGSVNVYNYLERKEVINTRRNRNAKQ